MPDPIPEVKRVSHTIVSLEVVRFLAAVCVFLRHYTELGRGPLHDTFSKINELPVVVFFVLSGFVIALRHHQRGDPTKPYFKARFIRIFPIYLVALCACGMLLADPAYRATLNPQASQPLTFFGNLAMLQGPDFMRLKGFVWPWGGDGPVWSLSFEWWFYMAYGIMYPRLEFKTMRVLVAACGLIGGVILLRTGYFVFLIATLFPLWWSGAELAKQYVTAGRLNFKDSWFAIGLLVLMGLSRLLLTHLGPDLPVDFKLIAGLPAFAAVIVAMSILGQKWLFRPYSQGVKLFKLLGGSSYALYLIHMPILLWVHVHHASPVMLLLIAFPLTLTLAILLENGWHKKVAAALR